MRKILVKKIAQKHIELRYPQPLRLQPDYGERNAADFLGENVVQVNTGISPLRGGPGNVKDEVIADDFEADFLSDDIDAEELEGFEIVDDMGLGRMSEFMKGSRFHSGPEGKKEFEQWKKDNPEAAETFDEQTEINKDVVKNRAKAMNSDDFQELDSEQKELEEKLEEIQEDKEDIVEDAGKTAHYEIIDDIGLSRTASTALLRKVQKLLIRTPLFAELESDYEGTDILIQWDISNVYEEDEADDYDDDDDMILDDDLRDLLSKVFKFVKQKHTGYVEMGTSDIDEGVYRIIIHDEIDYRMASSTRSELEILEDIEYIYNMLSPERLYQDGERSRSQARKVERELYKGLKDLFKELGREVDEYEVDEEIRALNRRTATDHGDSGSYMSRQNLREMGDMADFIVDDIGNEGLDDWVEDKISQAYSKLNDVARYRGYRDDHPHGEDEGHSFKLADDEIIDDMGIMAEFDKESKVKSHKHHSKKDVKDSYEEQKKNFGDDWAKYEGAMGPKGLDPARIQKNQGGGGMSALDRLGPAKKPSSGGGLDALSRLANAYDIIDDLEW